MILNLIVFHLLRFEQILWKPIHCLGLLLFLLHIGSKKFGCPPECLDLFMLWNSTRVFCIISKKLIWLCRYEIDKLTASQRLDLNLEKGRIRDELQALRDKTNELEIKVDKETNYLKAAVEQTKNEVIKYCLGMMFAFTTAGLGAARLFAK